MIDLETTKQSLARHGEIRSQPAGDWTGPFPLPADVAAFYRDVGPVDVEIAAIGNPFYLPSLAELWNFQAGYRWNGLSGEPIEDWNDDWLVVANQGGDPFYMSRKSGIVAHAFCGADVWNGLELFPSLVAMAACLAELGVMALEFDAELFDEDYRVRPEMAAAASQRLSRVLDSEAKAETVLLRLEWR